MILFSNYDYKKISQNKRGFNINQGTQMGEYGDKNYPEFFPGMSVKITLPYYSKKNCNKEI